jgi:hypothetical protein
MELARGMPQLGAPQRHLVFRIRKTRLTLFSLYDNRHTLATADAQSCQT